jgi:hypothetical protein
MDWEKYNKVPIEFATAKEIGLAAATLSAMARRGLVEVKNSVPKQYRRLAGTAVKILLLCEEHKDDYDKYFTLWRKGQTLGMYCYISNGTIYDCWDNKYDITDVYKIGFRKIRIDI